MIAVNVPSLTIVAGSERHEICGRTAALIAQLIANAQKIEHIHHARITLHAGAKFVSIEIAECLPQVEYAKMG